MTKMNEVDLLDVLPKTNRPIDERSKVSDIDRELSWKLDKEYFDGTRAQGYGGYSYDGRWKAVANMLIKYYNLNKNSKILDVGCAKGFLLYDFMEILPGIEVSGLDISTYALESAPENIKPFLCLGNATNLPFPTNYFDLVFCKDTLHNILSKEDIVRSLQEIERVSKGGKYIRLGAYHNQQEKEKLDKWAVVATTYLPPDEWLELFKKADYNGEYSWFNP
jgi:ubiquinone/menaquinone biosynthesis C-methylase UbiE